MDSLKILENVCDQGAGDIAGEAVERGLVLFEESGSGLAHLVLFPEDKVRIGINHFLAVQVLELDVGRDLDLERGGAPGGQVKSDNAGTYILDGSLQDGVGPRGIGRKPESCSLQELAADGGGELLFDAKGGGLVHEDGDGDGFDVGG